MKLFEFLQAGRFDKLLGGRYRLLEQLGEGGFGQTFLAEDVHLPGNPRCVVKQLKPQVSDRKGLKIALRLFNTEAQVLYQLGTHDQIPRLLAHFEEGQEFYLVQELVDGQPLHHELVLGHPWSEGRVIQLLQDILEVLEFVHQQNVIHRDIKPANLMRRSDGKIVLIDFGAVKQASTQLIDPGSSPTQTVSIGTQGYMPNEQLAGNPRFCSDVYAVGVIGIQALTGCALKQLGQDPQTSEFMWRDRAPQVSPELATVLDKMVCYDFRNRYPNAAKALIALRQVPIVPDLTAAETASSVPESLFPINNSSSVSTESLQASNESTLLSPEMLADSQPVSLTVNVAGVPQPIADAANLRGRATTNVGTTVALSRRSHPRMTALPAFVAERRWLVGTALGAIAATGLLLWLQPQRSSQTAQPPAPTSATAAPTPSAPSDQENQVNLLLTQAAQQREAGQYSESLNLYKQVVKLDAKSAEAHWGQCYNLNYLDRPDAAIAACKTALQLRPDYPEALWSQGFALEQKQQYPQALQLYEQAIALKPDFVEAWNNKGTALLRLNRFSDALEAFDQAIDLNPDMVTAWSNRGVALWELRKPEDAIKSLERAIALDPNFEDALSLRQQIREKFGR